MPDLLLPTLATVLTIPILALLAAGLAAAFDARRAEREPATRRDPHRSNRRLRGILFLACLATGTTASLLASGSLAVGGASLGALGALLGLAAACGGRLTRPPHANRVRAVSDAAAWWLGFGFLGGLTAQVLIQGGLLSAAALIALVAVAGVNALARDGGLGVQADEARLGESLDA